MVAVVEILSSFRTVVALRFEADSRAEETRRERSVDSFEQLQEFSQTKYPCGRRCVKRTRACISASWRG
jgi:hypothetical protein